MGTLRKIESFTSHDGHDYFIEYYQKLPKYDRVKILAMLTELEQINLLVAQRHLWVKRLAQGIYEIRCYVDQKKTYGILFFTTPNRIILTYCYLKQGVSTEEYHKIRAQEKREEWLEENAD